MNSSISIEEFFGPSGPMSKLDGYEHRPEQIQMAHTVYDAIANDHHAIVEGPTGVGKSLAYSIPAAMHALEGKKVAILTANIALQEQIVTKDLPFVRKLLGNEFDFELAKGFSNYACIRKSWDEDPTLRTTEDHEQYMKIRNWLEKTELGDVSELDFKPAPVVWDACSISSEECTKDKCPRVGMCFPHAARARVADAQVVVANYHLFFADMRVRSETDGYASVLPAFDVVVMDEAHEATDIARGFFGFHMTRFGLHRVTRALKHCDNENKARSVKTRTLAAIDELFERASQIYRSGWYSIRLREPNLIDVTDAVSMLDELKSFYGSQKGLTNNEEKEKYIGSSQDQCLKMALQLIAFTTIKDKDSVYAIEENRGRYALVSKVVDVAPIMKNHFFPNHSSVIITSATLAVGGRFDFIRDQLGVPSKDCDELVLESPFNMAENMLVVLGKGDPTQRDDFHRKAFHQIVEAIEQADGRTLALFTSRAHLNYVAERLPNVVPFKILTQGDMPNTKLLEAFREDTSSVLLGTKSFWAGVDVKGESLSCVIIDKLPFPNISDPVVNAINESMGRSSFMAHSVPEAVIQFKQGWGRLIRSKTDRGVVVLLDGRITRKRYGDEFFLGSFPENRWTTDHFEDIRDFLAMPAVALPAPPLRLSE